MYPFDGSMNPMLPVFAGARRQAANVPQPSASGNYTAEMFQSDFPQFFSASQDGLVPEAMLQMFVDNANASVLPERWGAMWRYAAGLYVAHFAALYLKTYAPSSGDASEVATGADQVGVVKSAAMGDTSISYDNSAITAATQEWGAWNSTIYGMQFLTQAKILGMIGMYII